MNLAALLSLGVPDQLLINELKKLKLNGYSIEVWEKERNGICGKQVQIETEHGDEKKHHRHLSDITRLIEESTLNSNVKKRSQKMFDKLGQAEAYVHGKSIDKVHFHEVGAVDSILDIVGAAICLDYLNPDRILSSAVEMGSGYVNCAHGTLPVPAPAVVELLRNIPVKSGNQKFETTTPTGAAILACNVDAFMDLDEFIINKVGYGIGSKEAETPNMLRVYFGECCSLKDQNGSHALIECNLDDMNPELMGHVMERLLQAGADDVFLTPIIMKKSRNGSMLNVIVSNTFIEKITEIIIHETTTFGYRILPINKTELKRDFTEIQTRFGKVKIKRAWRNGNLLKQKPEYEECAKISRELNIPAKDIYNEILSKLIV